MASARPSPSALKEKVDFINSLAIKGHGVHLDHHLMMAAALAAPEPADSVPTAKVAGSQIAVFDVAVPQQNVQDVLNAMLLAQLAAAASIGGIGKLGEDQGSHVKPFYDKYSEVLMKIGFPVGSIAFTDYQLRDASATVNKIVMDMMAAVLPAASAGALSMAIAAMTAAANSNAATIFSRSTTSNGNGQFGVGSVFMEGNVVAMQLGYARMTVTSSTTNCLFFSVSSTSSHVQTGAQKVYLNMDVVAATRVAVATKLGNNAKDFIADLDLGATPGPVSRL